MTVRKKIVAIMTLAFISPGAIAQQFDCRYVESLYKDVPAQLIEIDSCLLNGFRVKVDSLDGIVTNVGVKIPNIENLSDSLLESFAERKLLEVMLAKSQHDLINVLDYSKAKLFLNGADYIKGPFWDLKEGLNVVKENETMLIYRDSLNYSIQWGKNDDKFAINFPANIQAVTSKDKAELENELAGLLISDCDLKQDAVSVDVTSFEKREDNVYATKGDCFILDNITNSTYFRKDKQGHYELIYSPDQIAETFANLF